MPFHIELWWQQLLWVAGWSGRKWARARYWTLCHLAVKQGSDTFVHRGEVAMLHCVCTAGTEIHSCLALSGGYHSEGKECLLLPRGIVALSQVSLLNILYNCWGVDQSQALPWVLSIPVHGVMIEILFTVQSHISSFLSEQVFWGLSDAPTHCAYGKKRKVGETKLKRVPQLLLWGKDLDLELGTFRTGICSLNPRLTYSQETKGHAAQHLVAHGGKRVHLSSNHLQEDKWGKKISSGDPLALCAEFARRLEWIVRRDPGDIQGRLPNFSDEKTEWRPELLAPHSLLSLSL